MLHVKEAGRKVFVDYHPHSHMQPHVNNLLAVPSLQNSPMHCKQFSGHPLYLSDVLQSSKTDVIGRTGVLFQMVMGWFGAQLWSIYKVNADAMNGHFWFLSRAGPFSFLKDFPWLCTEREFLVSSLLSEMG